MPAPSVNILGQALQSCALDPVTGFYRDGCCNTGPEDQGSHTVCAIMTDEFLAMSRYLGNDLSTPRPEYGFKGLQAGDQWCLCASRFLQAHHEDAAPMIRASATHIEALKVVPMAILRQYAIDLD